MGSALLDMVENRFVGIKSRGVYETPAGTILLNAHMDIEGIAMDREVMRLRNMLSPVFAEIVYNGFWFSPEMDFLRAAIDKSQELIDGIVYLTFIKAMLLLTDGNLPVHFMTRNFPVWILKEDLTRKTVPVLLRSMPSGLMAHNAIPKRRENYPEAFRADLLTMSNASGYSFRKNNCIVMKLWEKGYTNR